MARTKLNEGNIYPYTLRVPQSTSGETVTLRIKQVGETGTGTQVGGASGAAANTNITIQLDTSGLAPAIYELEVWADYDGAGKRIIQPKPEDTIPIEIIDRFGV